MQIEVTEREAKMVFCNRYMEKNGGDRFFFLKIIPVLVVAVIASYFVMTYVNDWLGVAVLVIVASPTVILYLKLHKASRRYINEQMKG